MNLFHPFFEFTVARTTDVQCFGLVVGLVTYNLQHKGFVVDVGVGALSVGGKEQSALFFFARCITVREVRGMKLKISFLPIAPRFAGTFLQVALARYENPAHEGSLFKVEKLRGKRGSVSGLETTARSKRTWKHPHNVTTIRMR